MPLKIEDLTGPVEEKIQRSKAGFEIEKATRLTAANPQGEKIGFVDVVMEGGGVNGITTAGAIYAMERLGFRFRKIAGTSAGAICAALLVAAGEDALDMKSTTLTKILSNMDFYSFVDGGADARALLKSYNNPGSGTFFKEFLQTMRKGISLIRNVNDLVGELGINPGNEFKAFITDKMESLNDHMPFTVAALQDKLTRHIQSLEADYQIPGTFTGQDFAADFQVVVSDVSFQRKAVFPRDTVRYFKNPDNILVGDFVRASMSIPIFFEPFRLIDFTTGEANLKASGHIAFVDGGLVSNFPLSLFDVKGKPRCPTFGLLIDELKGKQPEPNKVDNLFELGMAMFETTREYGDKAYVAENPSAAARIIRMSNTGVQGKKIGTTDFDIADGDKIQLFKNGVQAVLEKMSEWDFEKYIRKFR